MRSYVAQSPFEFEARPSRTSFVVGLGYADEHIVAEIIRADADGVPNGLRPGLYRAAGRALLSHDAMLRGSPRVVRACADLMKRYAVILEFTRGNWYAGDAWSRIDLSRLAVSDSELLAADFDEMDPVLDLCARAFLSVGPEAWPHVRFPLVRAERGEWEAHGISTADGFSILAGARLPPREFVSGSKSELDNREYLLRHGHVFDADDGFHLLLGDEEFSDPIAAARFAFGDWALDRICWRSAYR